VASLLPVDVDMPLAVGAEPARASDGSTTVSARAATVAIAVARPMDENKAFRANISITSVAA
jgi:hypothetical protein